MAIISMAQPDTIRDMDFILKPESVPPKKSKALRKQQVSFGRSQLCCPGISLLSPAVSNKMGRVDHS